MNTRAHRTRDLVRAHKQFNTHLVTKRVTKRRGPLPKQTHPKRIAIHFARRLRKLVSKQRVRAAFAQLLAVLPELLRRNADKRKRGDAAGDGPQIKALVDIARQRMKDDIHASAVTDLASEFFDQTEEFNRVQLGKQVAAALGVNILADDSQLKDIAATFIDANVSLITKLPDRIADDVESKVMNGVQTGLLYGDLADNLDDAFGFGETRAKIIARDQIGKAYGQVNVARQQDLGCTQFIWRTSEDERVRDEHDAIDGETFDNDEGAPGEGLPGEPVMCRCSAEPVFDELADDDDDEDSEDDSDEDD